MREPDSEKDMWWAASDNAPSNGSPNYEMDEKCVSALHAVLVMLLGPASRVLDAGPTPRSMC